MQLTPGKIFLADERGKSENSTRQLFSTFNFREYQHEYKTPFGRLHTFNDVTLAAAATVMQSATLTGVLLILPITGSAIFNQTTIEPGQVLAVPVAPGFAYRLTNPYPADWINLLWIEIVGENLPQADAQLFNFDLEHTANTLSPAITGDKLPINLHIGRFDGRREALYHVKPDNQLFAFVLGGAFELQNRLLHERDGLALWSTDTVEPEALSNDAVLLLLELSPA